VKDLNPVQPQAAGGTFHQYHHVKHLANYYLDGT